jgi:hypothetical protein
MIRPHWAFQDYYLFNIFSNNNETPYIILEGLEHHFDLLPYVPELARIFVFIPTNMVEWNFKYARECLENQAQKLNPNRITYLCNSIEQVKWAKNNQFNSILCHHNAFINSELFAIKNDDSERLYDIVLNTRPENIKRPWLAADVGKIAIIQGILYHKQEFYDLNLLKPNYINNERISPQEVNNLYNLSLCGGIFSAAEGGCISSGEYMLSGLPVISSYCTGGRETYYRDFNSILVDDNPNEVVHAVQKIKYNLAKGIFNRQRIREFHIGYSKVMINELKSIVEKFAKSDNLQPTFADKFINNLIKKRIYYYPAEKCVNMIRGEFSDD